MGLEFTIVLFILNIALLILALNFYRMGDRGWLVLSWALVNTMGATATGIGIVEKLMK